MRLRIALISAVAVLGIASCGGGGSDATSSSELGPLNPPVYKTIPATSSSLSPSATGDVQDASGAIGGETEPTYKVQSGDYPLKVASRFGCTWEEIASYNDLKADSFPYPGESVKLPDTCLLDPNAETTAAPVDSATPASETATTTVAPSADGSTKYTIQSGDYPLGVAKKFDCSWAEIAAASGIEADPNKFPYPGEELTIPGKCNSPA